MNDAIVIKNLTKVFDSITAVDHINLSIKEGEIFGFLGPNGAGKTTAIKMLCTILNPTSGLAKVCGYDIVQEREEVRESIGIVFQDPAIDTFLTGRENLDFHARMYHMDGKIREKRIAEVLSLLNLEGRENFRIGDCSGGIQRRFEVARGFINQPKVLFLDEPTLGMDVQTRRTLWDYIDMLNKQEGITVILTTHYIEEADYLCHRVAIMDQGKIIAMDTSGKLKEVVGLNSISLQISQGEVDSLVNLLKQLAWIKKIEATNGSVELTIDGAEERLPELIDFADDHEFDISSINLHKPSLEDAFLYYTGKAIREEEGSIKEIWKAMMIRGRGKK